MNISHSWFRSGSYTLPRQIDIPQTGCGRLGIVIVPPFGWEDVCSYRPLRFLGKALSANGIPALRFDLPGTGDSSGSALDSRLVGAWIQSIGDAAAELRATAGVENVAAVGIGLGAMLAVTAAARGADLQDLILWGPAPSGRALVRELRVFARMEIPESASGEPPPPQPVPGLEVAGFLINPETQKDLESLDMLALPRMQGRRIMVLSRDDLVPDVRLVSALKASGGILEVRAGLGYAAMMAAPHDAIPPAATGRVIVEFLHRDKEVKVRALAGGPMANSILTEPAAEQTAVIEAAGSCVFETIHRFGSSSASIFGILSKPATEPRSGLCLLFLNPGAVRHIGSNRMWVEAARRWAARGVPSIRMDFRGIGESGGEPRRDTASLYETDMLNDIESVIAESRSRLGARRFVVIGLCSGAFWAFHTAVRYPEVRGAILLNPRLFFWDPEVDRRRVLRRTVNGLADSGSWRRLVLGKITSQRIRQAGKILVDRFCEGRAASGWSPQIPSELMARSLAAIENNQSRLTLVFTEGEPLLLEMEEERQLPLDNNPRFRCVRFANCGHTFRPLWAQQLVHDLIDRELDAVLQDSPQILNGLSAKSSG